MGKSSSNDELTIRNQFDRICKLALKGEAADYYRHIAYRQKHEVLFSELSQKELDSIFGVDKYTVENKCFRVLGYDIEVKDTLLPMSVWSIVTWLKNARNSSDGTVEIRKITRKGAGVLVLCNVAVTIAFYILLKKLNTPNLIFSTISVVTSFFAASLTMLRSSYYALGYASNDIVLIILWILASIKDPGYIPVVVNFLIFFLNDMYGFICWKKRETAQC